MDKYTPSERADILLMFNENNRSIIATQRAFRRKYPNHVVPHKTTIYRLFKRFEEYGTTADKPRTGGPRTARNAENIARVIESFEESPETSIRQRAAQLNLSDRTIRRILKLDLAERTPSHTDIQPHRCTICNKFCVSTSDLETHLHTHSAELPHVCEECGRGFARNGSLKLHMRSHSGIKLYDCGVCGKKYGHSGNLAKHVKKHHSSN